MSQPHWFGSIARVPPATETPLKKFPRLPDFLTAGGITLAAVWFHIYFLHHAGGFWRDEVNLLNVATQHSPAEMTRDSFPLLMPLLVKSWAALGLASADANLRLLGAAIGLGGLAALWLAAWTARRAPPLLSLGLFALNSTAITYGDELRAYGLGSLMIALLFTAGIYFLKQPGWKRAGIFTLCAVLSVQALFHNAVLVGAICLGALAVCARRKNFSAALKVFGAGLVAAFSLLPYLQNFIGGRAAVAVLRTGFSWPRFFHELAAALGFPWEPFAFVWALLALALFFFAAKVVFQKVPAENPAEEISSADLRLLAGATLFAAVAGFLGFLWLTALPGQPWYFLPLMMLAVVCFDGVTATVARGAKLFILTAAVVTFFLSLRVTQRDLNYRFTNLDGWAAALTSEAAPDDFAVVTPWFTGITFAHYFHGTMPWTTLPPLADHATHRYDQVQAQMKTANAVAPVLEKISATLRAGHRVWFLCPPDFVPAALKIPTAPTDLPPPPLPQTGWLDEPYSATWTLQVIHFLAAHGKNFRQINPPDPGQRTGENSGLFVVAGWHETTNSISTDAK